MLFWTRHLACQMARGDALPLWLPPQQHDGGNELHSHCGDLQTADGRQLVVVERWGLHSTGGGGCAHVQGGRLPCSAARQQAQLVQAEAEPGLERGRPKAARVGAAWPGPGLAPLTCFGGCWSLKVFALRSSCNQALDLASPALMGHMRTSLHISQLIPQFEHSDALGHWSLCSRDAPLGGTKHHRE